MQREIWEQHLFRIINPVIEGFINQTIKQTFPLNFPREKGNIVFIELLCRTVLGVATYLNLATDDLMNKTIQMIEIAFSGYLSWDVADQLMVEMALLSLAFVRCPTLWQKINPTIKTNILAVIKKGGEFKEHNNNWILFKCMIDIFLYQNQIITDIKKCELLLQRFEQFYVGDGWYKDGPDFKMDYYNSYVIHPFLVDIYTQLEKIDEKHKYRKEVAIQRLQTISIFLERLIGPDGTFPMFGRSAVYRTAVFHALVYCCYLNLLPPQISYSQIREGLTLTLNKMFTDKNFDKNGYLEFGFNGFQKEIANSYSNTGSLYFALLVFIPLGLPDDHPFWTQSAKEWTQKRLWCC